jgi:hypothetical protein
MNNDTTLRVIKRRGTALAFIAFAAVWVFAFAVHPDLVHPHFMLGPEDLIRRAHHNGLLQLAHAMVTLNTALLVVITLHFMKILERTPAARAGVVGAVLAVVGACLLAADKGAMCLTVSALDTLPDRTFDQTVPGLVAVFSHQGWMALVWGLVLMPIGVIIQAIGMMRVKALPIWQSSLLLLSLPFIGFPDGAEIVNLVAALALAAVLIPYGIHLWTTVDQPAASDGQHDPTLCEGLSRHVGGSSHIADGRATLSKVDDLTVAGSGFRLSSRRAHAP